MCLDIQTTEKLTRTLVLGKHHKMKSKFVEVRDLDFRYVSNYNNDKVQVNVYFK